MEELDIARIIKKIIVTDGEIILPSIGAIELQDLPATFSGDGKVINPPYKKVSFNTLRFNDNNALAKCVSENGAVTLEEGEAIVREFINSVRTSIEQSKRYEIRGVGTLVSSKTGGIEFEAAPSFEIVSDSFGLGAVTIEEQTDETTVQQNAPTDAQDTDTHSNTIEVIAETEKTEQANLENETAEKDTQSPVNQTNTEVPERSEKQTEQNPVSQNITTQPKVQEGQEKSDLQTAKKDSESSKKKTWLLVVLWIFIVLISLMIIALLIYIFREPLRPVLEKLLYNSEQLKIMHYNL